MEKEFVFNGTPVEFWSAAKHFEQTAQAKSMRTHLWIFDPHSLQRLYGRKAMPTLEVQAGAGMVDIRFASIAPVVDGKRGASPSGAIHVAKTPGGCHLSVSAKDEDWTALEPVWTALGQHLTKMGWKLDPTGEAAQEGAGESNELQRTIDRLSTYQPDCSGEWMTSKYTTIERIAIAKLWRKWKDDRGASWTRAQHAARFCIPEGTLTGWIRDYEQT